MIRDTLPAREAQSLYDRLGALHDWAEIYEGTAQARAMEKLDLQPGQRLLNVGAGTGKEHARFCQAVYANGWAVALDLSAVMLRLTRARTLAPTVQGDAHCLPFAPASFDRLYAAYVLDLIPWRGLPVVLAEFRRVVRPNGRLVLLSLTEGVGLASRALIAAWKGLYALSPRACGGCRPLQLAPLVRAAGFDLTSDAVVVQWGVPSEVLVATR